MSGCSTSGQRIGVCVVCGAQFLRILTANRPGTTCSAACLGWLRQKQGPGGGPVASRSGRCANGGAEARDRGEGQGVSSSLDWVVVWNDHVDGREYRDRSRSHALALNAACDLISRRHTVQRIKGPNGVVIRRETIEQYCQDRPRLP